MDKLKALMNFTMFAEKIEVEQGKEILIGNVKETIVKDKIITINEKRAKEIESATYKGEPLVERIKAKKEIETADIKTNNVEKAVKTTKRKKIVKAESED